MISDPAKLATALVAELDGLSNSHQRIQVVLDAFAQLKAIYVPCSCEVYEVCLQCNPRRATTILNILSAISSTKPVSFGDFCYELDDDCPERGDKRAWAALFAALDEAEGLGYVNVVRAGNNIDTLVLTEEGVAKIKQLSI